LSTQTSTIKPLQSDTIGIAFVLLSGLGVIFLPTTAKFAYLDGSNGVAYCVAWVAFFAGARILGATRASMLTLVEPPGAALGAWLLFGETYTPLQWAGFFVVLAALFLFEKLSYSAT